MMQQHKTILFIEDAQYLEDYKISLKFNDGAKRVVDFKDFLQKAKHPDIQKYKDIEKFKSFEISYGDLEWNDYELAFPVADLYNNTIVN